MKSIKHFLLAVVALATILTVVSCKEEDDSPAEVASYTGKSYGETVTVTVYDNGTFRAGVEVDGHSITYEGTYKGDVNKDEEITLQLTKATVDGQVAPEDLLAEAAADIGGDGNSTTVKGIISNSGKKLTLGSKTYKRISNENGRVASFVSSVGGVEVEVIFYDNGTFRMDKDDGSSLEGTYTGNAGRDGELMLELTKAIQSDGQVAPETVLSSFSIPIGGEGLSKRGVGTISDNGEKLTLGSGTYTRS